jgi:predicted transcriptional regulator
MVGAIYDFFTLPRQVREVNMRSALLNGFGPRGRNYRYVEDADYRVKGKETNERVILRIAKQNKGVITATELALEAGIPIEDAKKDLEAMVTKGFAEMRVRKSGALVYTIPELMDSDSPLEDW